MERGFKNAISEMVALVDCGLWNVATRSTRNTRNGGGIESGFVVRHLRLQSFEEAFTATYGAGAVSAASMKEMMAFAEKACLTASQPVKTRIEPRSASSLAQIRARA